MLAHSQGGILNASALAGSLGISGRTAANYVDVLVDLLLVRRLVPWRSNVGKRLVKSPRVYVRDSGLVHALLGLETRDQLLGHPVAGASREGFAIENVLALCPDGSDAHFYRTAGGAAIDLVVTLPGRGPLAIEVKRSLSPTPSKGFHIGMDDVGAARGFVVYPGTEAFPLSARVDAVPLGSRLVDGLAAAVDA